MVNDSVEIAEDAADDERDRVRIRYYSVTHSREETITSCEGDLIVISALERRQSHHGRTVS